MDSRVYKIPPTRKVFKELDLCQQNNVFEVDGQLYRQVEGHGTGQKQAPPVACLGAGEVEEELFNIPWIKEFFDLWSRYIDDLFLTI